ncbi:ATPase AAA [Paludibacterium paludis]|uniref:ATPase AAA n=1 Tax=Paludibacterium paludis TaxID=1225769 RepID=A0A918U750_9NEIS|nr:ATPase AAA [Paludibacterium paludis]
MVAGPNGAGKSTLTDRYLMGRMPVVNPDNILREQPGIGVIQAGKIAIRFQRLHLAARESFAWETTLSGHRELTLMREAKTVGYKVNLVFVCLRNARASILRVAERVAAGGHDIPPADVIRRFERCQRNLPEALAIADRAFLFDNSGERRRLLLTRAHNQSRHISRNLPGWMIDVLPAALLSSRGAER